MLNTKIYYPRSDPRPMHKARPILKWAGGKYKLYPQYKTLGLIPNKHGTYYEPFLGSAGVYLQLNPKIARLSDLNEDLINVYLVVQKNPEKLILMLEKHNEAHNNDYFYQTRTKWRDGNKIERAAKFIYLNKTCFNGLYRVNASGDFNVPIGHYKTPNVVDEKAIRLFSTFCQDATFKVKNYRAALQPARKGDFVYLDPPYQPTTASASFTSYTKNGFGEAEQEELKNVFDRLHKVGCKILLSNSDTQLIRDLYSEHYISEIDASRCISCKGNERGRIKELAITNFKPVRYSL